MLRERNLGTSLSFRKRLAVAAICLAMSVLVLTPLMARAAQLPVDLGPADSFGVLAGQGVTNTLTGFTVIDGAFIPPAPLRRERDP